MQAAEIMLNPTIQRISFNWPLNAHWAEKTIDAFKCMAERGARRIVIDMQNVSFIDSHGLAALVTGAKYLGEDMGQVHLAGLQAQAKLFFELTKFDKVFQIEDA